MTKTVHGKAMSKVRRIEFLGSHFWLIVWTILFFPMAGFYFLTSSILIEEEIDVDHFVKWYRSQDRTGK